MFKKPKTAAPFFRTPTPYNPVTGQQAPLTEPHPYMFGKVSTEITARSGITPGVGQVTLYILKTGKTDMFETTKDVEVRQVDDTAIEVGEYVLLLRDEYTRYWAIPNRTTQMKHGCRFTANAAFTTASEYVAGTISDVHNLSWGSDQFGEGTVHASTTARFYNLKRHSGASDVYEFYGDSGDAGLAYYMGVSTYWAIYMFECP